MNATAHTSTSSHYTSGLTLEELAAKKRLPIALLGKEGWWTVHTRDGLLGVGIPWLTAPPGRAYHVRLVLNKGSDRWRWDLPKGLALAGPYGFDHIPGALARARAEGRVPIAVICESEADALTLWLNGAFAVATGGAQSWRKEWAESLASFVRVFIAAEPDPAGAIFASAVARDLVGAAHLDQEVRVVPFPAEIKDPGALWLAVGADRPTFKVRLLEFLDLAVPASEWLVMHPAPAPLRERGVHQADGPSWLPLVFDAIMDYLQSNGGEPRPTKGGGYVARCPLHGDRSPSLSVHPQRGWRCWAGCGEGKLTALAYTLGVRV